MKNGRLYRLSTLVVFFALLPLAIAHSASGYPAPAENYVNDFAKVISDLDAQMLRDKLQTLEKETGIEGTVVTVNSIADYQTGATSFEAFATGLFNEWGVGNKSANNGFMVLIAIRDRTSRIELGDGYGIRYNTRMKEIIEQTMIPRFKATEYSRGVYDGTIAVVDSLTRKVSWLEYYKWQLLGALGIVVCVFAGISCIRNGKVGWGYVFFAAAGFIFIWLLRSIFKSKGDTSNSSSGFGGGSSSGKGGASGSW